jgi:hypothetical protein
VRKGELSEDRFMTSDYNSDRSLKAESAQMRYLFEGMTGDAGPFSSEKGKCGEGGSRMGTKKQDCKSRNTMYTGVLRKELKHTVIQIFFKLWLMLKPAE